MALTLTKKLDLVTLKNENQMASRNNVGLEIHEVVFDGTISDVPLPTGFKSVLGYSLIQIAGTQISLSSTSTLIPVSGVLTINIKSGVASPAALASGVTVRVMLWGQ